jgi:hypothetical protein
MSADGILRLQNRYELRDVAMDDEVAMETVDATQPTVAMEPAGVTEPCAHCGAALARDQRYCLECGVPRTYLSGMLLERLRAPAGQAQAGQATDAMPPNGALPYGPQASSNVWQRGNVLMLIAGIGVLLLAMGVGVLIGRSGSSGSSGTPPPAQVIVASPAAGAAGATTTPSTPEATSTTPAKTPSPTPTSKAKPAPSGGVGSVPSKPAPPSVLKNLHTHSNGESFEQKSKNLPNVVETG